MKRKNLTNEQIGTFALAMSHLLRSGITAADALVLLGMDETEPGLEALWASMAKGLDAGDTLAGVLEKSGSFPAYVCTLTEVGEETGKLQQTVEALARHYRDRAKLERQLRSALVSPMVLLAVLLGVVAALLIWVLPVFDRAYAQLGSGLTGTSAWLLALGNGLKSALPWIAVAIALLGGVLAVPGVRKGAVKLFRRIWGDRGIFRKLNTARFLQALWLCVSSGMTGQEAVGLAASLGAAPAFQKRCGLCREEAEAGAALSQALRSGDMLSASQCRFLEVGERSGRSEQVLETLSQDLLEEGEAALIRTVSAVEPVLVTACSALIGAVLLTVLLPLLYIMTAIG
jgi:type IV pilus assembly protein PilC